MDLDGRLGVFASGLRWPSALAVFRKLTVAELGGRVTILGLNGQVIASAMQRATWS